MAEISDPAPLSCCIDSRCLKSGVHASAVIAPIVAIWTRRRSQVAALAADQETPTSAEVHEGRRRPARRRSEGGDRRTRLALVGQELQAQPAQVLANVAAQHGVAFAADGSPCRRVVPCKRGRQCLQEQ